jgi:hypothetical protein
MRGPESPDLAAPSALARLTDPAAQSRLGPCIRAGAGPRGIRVLLLLLPVLGATSCGPRYERITVHERDGVTVELRAETREGKAVDRGFTHPVTISEVRVTNILSRIDIRPEGKKEAGRRPAIPAELLYPLGSHVSAALAKANPSQEVVVKAIRKERRLGIFTQRYLTSFVIYVKGDELYVHLSRVDWAVPKASEDSLPEPWPDRQVMQFKVIPSNGIVPAGAQAVSVVWRDSLFRSGAHLKLRPGGKVMRRHILLESPEEDLETAAPEVEGNLSPETLRALADLEEARRKGAISEAEYQDRRRRILHSELEAQPAQ